MDNITTTTVEALPMSEAIVFCTIILVFGAVLIVMFKD